MTRILLVEDEESFSDPLSYSLTRDGFEVEVAADGAAALAAFDARGADLVLLDLMLPGMSGVDVCRRLRRDTDVPVIMVSAKDSEIDKVVGLELGADDYITKPYSYRELLARVNAVLRRRGPARSAPGDGQVADGGPSGSAAGAPTAIGRDVPRHAAPTTPELESEVLRAADVELDIARHEATVRGAPVSLPRKEFELLEFLLANAGRVLTRGQLIERVWGADYVGDTKTLDVHIGRLRAKIEREPSEPRVLVTVRGIGYRIIDG